MILTNSKQIITTLIVILLYTLNITAQRGTLFNANGQLSSSLVHQVYQDKNGIIWVCTENGLNAYDGYNFQVYTVNNGLFSDNINCVCQGVDNKLYIGTTNGLNVLVNNTIHPVFKETGDGSQQFKAYHVTDMCVAPDSTIYISTSGRGIWQITKKGQVRKILDNNNDVLFTQKIKFDRKGVLWIVTNINGIISFKDGKTKKYTFDKSVNHADMAVDKHNNLYIGIVNGGVYKATSSRKGFKLIPSTAKLPVTSLMTHRDGNLLVGTNGDGLQLLNTRTEELTAYQLYCNELNMNRTKVYSILKDHTGNLWLALMQKGIFMQPPHTDIMNYVGHDKGPDNPIGDACVNAVFAQSNGTIWVAADQDGLYALTPNGSLIRHYKPDVSSPKSVPSTVLTITEDNKGRLWIGSFTDGYGWLDTNTGEYHRSGLSYEKNQSVFDLRIGSNNELWVGTLGNGLIRQNLKTGKSHEYKTAYDNNKYKHTICNDFIMQMEIDQDGRYLFVGTTTGLSCLNLKTNRWDDVLGTNRLFEGQAIRGIRYRKDMGLWVGTSIGLYNIILTPKDDKKYSIKHYTTKDGLTDNHVSSIEIDSSGRVWVSTSKGLCCLTPKTGHFISYYESDGLQGNEYTEGTSYQDKSGNLYFGGTMGLSFFNPKKVINRKQKLSVKLSQILVGGEIIKAGSKSGMFEVCNTDVTVAPRFDFSHQDNTITLRFSTLTYSGLKHISYRYSINGDDWITLPSGKNELTLNRMPPGDYKFLVEAVGNGTISETKKFIIVIHNPWYFTPMARIIYALIIICIIYGYLRSIKTRNQERLALQEHMHAEEMNEQKLRSFINLSHEIRTPMTLILTPLLQLIKEETDSHRKATYEIIRRNAERILHLVNQIMDIRKIDKGLMAMHMRETDFVMFVEDVINMFRLHASSKRIEIHFLHEGFDSLPVWIDRSQFDKVLINLMSNAVKYAKTGGMIEVTIETTGQHCEDNQSATQPSNVTLTVFNTGDNIPEESLNHIFERFYQISTSSAHTQTGTGVGLDLTRSLVRLHHGEIKAYNTDDGVKFIVTLPLGKEHLSEEEIATCSEKEESHEDMLAETEEPKENVQEEVGEIRTGHVSTSRRATIVIVEDDDEIRNYLMTELSSTYRTLSYTNGADALPAILREIPQLVISDVMMPNMDGYTLCAKIKSNVNTNHVPVILITAKTRDEDKLEGLETGADLYVTKPFNLDILRRNIANLIASRKVMQNKFTGMEDQRNQIDEIEIENADEKLLNRIMQVINANINNSDLNIEMICDEVGISRVHLHRKMKEMTNQTPHDFIKNLRLKQAARLLSKKGQSVTEVMYRCGFNSATSFSTMFKKMYGMSPRDYKKEHEET